MITDPAALIFEKQTLWAQRKGRRLCGTAGRRGRLAYTATVADNLFEPLSPEAREDFAKGDGGELGQGGSVPGKMQAVHSSSALSANLFHYWRRIGRPDIVARACGLSATKIAGISFEQHLPIDPRFRFSPNLNAVFTYNGGSIERVGVECKFSEPFSSRAHLGLKEKYFDPGVRDLWMTLPSICALGKKMCPENTHYKYLDAAQLVKHLLGLRRCSGNACRLLYLYYDVPGAPGVRHAEEIADFISVAARDGVVVTAATYQDVLLRLAGEQRSEHSAFVDYMIERYL